MFEELKALAARPAPFCATTTHLLWADPHISEHMLSCHLDGSSNTASRTTDFIDRCVGWLTGPMDIGTGSRVLDLGCGPGLYSNRLAALGADVTGVDFSARSIDHARGTAPGGPRQPTYLHGDYLDVAIPGTFDVALMICCDFCALSPEQRGGLLARLRTLLGDGGRFIVDVYGLAWMAAHEERRSFTANPCGGFWSPEAYFEFVNSFVYESERVTLDKYDIIEATRQRTIYNWLQCYDIDALADEFRRHGFEVTALLGDLTGAPFEPDSLEFAVVATPTIAEPPSR
ncbi:MAG: class I SAM-dependent methyltransferase [Micromonosporaceae bacterium]|nr:class I SAM-dependent methyltransferase [Micromonosporaceae bacterium]